MPIEEVHSFDKVSLSEGIRSVLNELLGAFDVEVTALEICKETILLEYVEDEFPAEFPPLRVVEDISPSSYLQLSFSLSAKLSEEGYEAQYSVRIRVGRNMELEMVDIRLNFCRLPRGKRWTDKLKEFLERWGRVIAHAILTIIRIWLE